MVHQFLDADDATDCLFSVGQSAGPKRTVQQHSQHTLRRIGIRCMPSVGRRTVATLHITRTGPLGCPSVHGIPGVMLRTRVKERSTLHGVVSQVAAKCLQLRQLVLQSEELRSGAASTNTRRSDGPAQGALLGAGWQRGPVAGERMGREDPRYFLIAGWKGGYTQTHIDHGVQVVLYHTVHGLRWLPYKHLNVRALECLKFGWLYHRFRPSLPSSLPPPLFRAQERTDSWACRAT